jgi:Trk K+ transport system NAD-binding subunit
MIPAVTARIYDPRRAEIYQRLGISTVATVRWTIDQVLRGSSRAHRDRVDRSDWARPTHHT